MMQVCRAVVKNATWGCAPSVLLLILLGCRHEISTDLSQELAEIEARFAESKEARDFQTVAAAYDDLLSAGHDSALIWYNRGLALLEGGDTGRALASFRRAEQLRPRDPNIRAALRQSGVAVSAGSPATVWDALLGLHWNRLSMTEKCRLGTGIILVTMTLGCLCTAMNARRTFWGVTLLGGCLAGGILGTSMYESYYQTQRLHAVVTEETKGHRGPAAIYEPTWSESLTPGTEVRVLELTPEWIRVEWTGHGEAWIRSHAIERY